MRGWSVLWGLVALDGGGAARAAPAVPAGPPPSTVLALFSALPDSALHERIRDRAAVLDEKGRDEAQALRLGLGSWTAHDPGADILRIRSIGDGEGWREEFRVYATPTGESVLLGVSTQWGMCGEQSRVRVWGSGAGGLVEVTADRWPVLAWTDFNRGRPTSEKHARAPVYSVDVRTTGDVVVALDGCQFEHPGVQGPLAFDGPLDAPMRTLPLRWDGDRFVVHEPAGPDPG